MAKTLEAPLLEHSPAELHSLEEKISRTIEMLKTARDAKNVAERESHRLRKQLAEREDEFDDLRAQVVSMRKEREEVKARMERLLARIDELAAEEAEA